MQFDGVALGFDSHPHPFTIGSQQDRLHSEPAFVPDHHPHGSSTSTSLSWLSSGGSRQNIDLFGYGSEVLVEYAQVQGR
jgi:hypothetical protein